MAYICFDGQFMRSNQPVFTADDFLPRYGNGLFETMYWHKGIIRLATLHFQRLEHGMQLLGWIFPTKVQQSTLENLIHQLVEMNGGGDTARVRLSVSSGKGTLKQAENSIHYLLECSALPPTSEYLDPEGIHIGIFPDARKSCDRFSNLKSANYLPYLMAARYAANHQLDDCLVLNSQGRIADGSIANIFLINDDQLITPALDEGCVKGIMRQHIIEQFKDGNAGYRVVETMVTADQLLQADEIFLTNAISVIRGVKQFRDKVYNHIRTAAIYKHLVQTF